ncbi:MAG TPA: bifunctional 4-hydroxy-2-oxoglutarate aldolase/2-dehydro-3-deoxy-phosphogluconate aldolase [Puia sp.]|nr:bifunctional 4-hydroxy-2-oxoglutarate aldolase/2-dehydro-3-deoxy-phosphogluconate aldolase [Puia sp.]
MTALEQIFEYRIVAILRGCPPERVPAIAGALADGGIRLLEITLNSDGALDAIREVVERLGNRLLVGAGTVLTAAEAESAIGAGAAFVLSPSIDTDTIRITRQLGAVSIPGAFTATEILTAHRAGADLVKVFPASVGAGYFRDLRGPLSGISLMPAGGINLENIRSFRAAGAAAYGIGGALVPAGQETGAEALRGLRQRAGEFIKALA